MKSPRPQFLLSILLSTFLLKLHAIPDVDTSPTPDPSAQSFDGSTEFIRTSCNSTLYPEICYSSLTGYARTLQQDPAQIARVAMSITLHKAKRIITYVSNLSRQADNGDTLATAALHDCLSNFGDAVEEIDGSLKQMQQLNSSSSSKSNFGFLMSNVQTWMSSALTNENTCTDGFEDVTDGPMKKDICDRVEYVKKLTSNALALVNRYAKQQ